MSGRDVGWLKLPVYNLGREYTKGKKKSVKKRVSGLSGEEIITKRLKKEKYKVHYVSPKQINKHSLVFHSCISAAGYIELLKRLPEPDKIKTKLH